jgi:hypothetical protein
MAKRKPVEKPDPPSLVQWLLDRKKKKKLYVGIDPGAQGAVAFIHGDDYLVVDMPTRKVKVKGKGRRKTRTDYDIDRIVSLFYGHQGFRGNTWAAVEQALPNVRGGKSAYNAYRVGMGYGMWPLFFRSKGYEAKAVHPSTWKAKLKLRGKGKLAAMRMARRLFPGAELHLRKHEGRCEALLIARYLKTLQEGE